MACVHAQAGISVSVKAPASATPCDTLSITTRVSNTGQTLDNLLVRQSLPSSVYSYIPGSFELRLPGGITSTNETGVVSVTDATNLLFDLTQVQTGVGPTNLLISKVAFHTNIAAQWVELFNPTLNPISIEGWFLRDARPGASNALPAYTLQAGEFLVIAADTNVFLTAFPGYTDPDYSAPGRTNSLFQVDDGDLGNGLARYADGLFLIDSNGLAVDQLSWGFDTTGLNPAVNYFATDTGALERVPANVDSNGRADWVQRASPTPGTGTVQVGITPGSVIDLVYQISATCGGAGAYFTTISSFRQPTSGSFQTNINYQYLGFKTPALAMSTSPATQAAALNELVTWTVQVRNSGFGIAKNVVLFDRIGPDLQYVGFSATPTNDSPLSLSQVSWDQTAIPALASLGENESASITVTARVVRCSGGLYNYGDATFGCQAQVCEDTRNEGGSTLATVLFEGRRPFLSFSVAPGGIIPVPYCSGVDITFSITNLAVPLGADAFYIQLEALSASGYQFSSLSSGTISNNYLLLGAPALRRLHPDCRPPPTHWRLPSGPGRSLALPDPDLCRRVLDPV